MTYCPEIILINGMVEDDQEDDPSGCALTLATIGVEVDHEALMEGILVLLEKDMQEQEKLSQNIFHFFRNLISCYKSCSSTTDTEAISRPQSQTLTTFPFLQNNHLCPSPD